MYAIVNPPLHRLFYYYYYYYYQCTDLSYTVTQTMQESHNSSEEGNKKLAKTEPKHNMCLQLLPKEGEG